MYSPGETLTVPDPANMSNTAAPLPSYEPMDRAIEANLISDALNANPELAQSDAPYVLLTLDGQSPYANVARALECRVFNEYFQNQPDLMQQEYGPYEDSSTFFLLVDREALQPAGVMRITHSDTAGFKSTNDLPTEKCKTNDGRPVTDMSSEGVFSAFEIDPGTTLDVATIATDPRYGEKATGSPLALASLMRAVYHYSLQNSYHHLVAIIDAVPLEKLQAVNLPIEVSAEIADKFEYLGAKGNTFIHIPIAEVEKTVSTKSPEVFDYVFGEAALMGECELSLIKQ